MVSALYCFAHSGFLNEDDDPQSPNDPRRQCLMQRNGATAVLRRLLRGSVNTSVPLSNESRERIANLARELIGKRFTLGNVLW
jgi:hypothetical protein